MYKKVLALLTVFILACSTVTAAPPSSWAVKEVDAAIKENIVPKRIQSDYQTAITREEFCEMAVLLWQTLKNETAPTGVTPFTDVDNAAVTAAYNLQIVQGVGNNLFSPAAPVTRQEMCVMLQNALRAAKPEVPINEAYPNTFPDGINIAAWALPAVQFMNINTVMLGDEFGNINPLGNATREQAILLTYRLLNTQRVSLMEYIDKNLMSPSGNTHDNMLNGGFVVGMSEGYFFYSDKTGITERYELDNTSYKATNVAAKAFTVYTDSIYFIAEDGFIYEILRQTFETVQRTNMRTDAFIIIGDTLYYSNLDDGNKLYKTNITTGVSEALTAVAAECPIITGKGKFYTDYAGIYSMADDATSTLLYSGAASHLCLRNETFYFINGENMLCTVDINGGNYKQISNCYVRSYAFMRDCIIAMGGTDGAVYKLGYNNEYCIRIDTGTYSNINTYDDYVYAQTDSGEIYKFENNATEKTKIN